MENILEKYARLRTKIKHGDLILFHGTGIVANIIQNCDKAYWNHVGVIVKVEDTFYIQDANANGVQADRLSWRIRKYRRDGDIAIISSNKSPEKISKHLKELLLRSDEKWIKYDFYNGAKELANRKFDWKLPITENEDRDICSDFIARYAYNLNIINREDFDKLRIAFPQDYERYLNLNSACIRK